MFQCPKCREPLGAAECPVCGYAEGDTGESAEALLEQLRGGVRPEPTPPRPFRERLASYAKRDESEVMLDRPWYSKMPLRIFAPTGPYLGGKPTWLIRRLLDRIQRCVRQD